MQFDAKEIATLILTSEFVQRTGLHTGNARETAEKFIDAHSDVFAKCFCAMAQSQNATKPKREWARAAGVTLEQFKEFWRSMRRAKIKGTDGVKRFLFRKEFELLAKLSDDDVGGVGLHLSSKGGVPFDVNRAIATSWAPAQNTINGTVAGAMDRIESDETVSIEERAAVQATIDNSMGTPHGETLPLLERLKSA